jgi:hypothetical protein
MSADGIVVLIAVNTLRLKRDTNTNMAYRSDYSQKMAAAYR